MVSDDDDDDTAGAADDGTFFEFECPECNAHNPHSEGFRVGGETTCFYCGTDFKVTLGSGRLKLKPV